MSDLLQSPLTPLLFALTWRCDGSEGIKWFLRGIHKDGTFYGEVLFQSEDPTRRIAVNVAGQLSAEECEQMFEIIGRVRQAVPPVEPGAHFGALFERLSQSNLGNAQRLFEYHIDDERYLEPARAFLELVQLIERHLVPFYSQIVPLDP